MTKTDELEDTFAIQMARTERLCMLVEKVLRCGSSKNSSNKSNYVIGRRGSVSTVSTASNSSVEEEEDEEIDKDNVEEEDTSWRSSRTSRRRSSVGVESTYTATTTDNDSCSLNLDSVVEDESSSIYTTSAKMTTSSTVEALRVSQLLSIYKKHVC